MIFIALHGRCQQNDRLQVLFTVHPPWAAPAYDNTYIPRPGVKEE